MYTILIHEAIGEINYISTFPKKIFKARCSTFKSLLGTIKKESEFLNDLATVRVGRSLFIVTEKEEILPSITRHHELLVDGELTTGQIETIKKALKKKEN